MADQPSGERSVFLAAIEIDSADGRKGYLDEACGDDSELRADVEALLREHHTSQGLLDAPDLAVPLLDEPIGERPGMMIGPYKLLEEIGEGGMGSVFMAMQEEPVRRKVALKVIKPGMDSRQVVSRFEAERQALAMMDHPCIARVFDGGRTESGRPYFVMELVDGIPITDYCDQHKLTTHQRLELFGAACRAVQHAHQKGVIHRDLKPSNILVTQQDDKAVPKVIDFGIAKATSGQLSEEATVTHHAQMIGTPLYMSPEQASLNSVDIDTRSDVYSLGVLLYELLTGTTPFEPERMHEVSHDEFRRIIREEEPPRPSARLTTIGAKLSTISEQRSTDARKLAHTLRGDPDWIVMKALEKDRDRRYETANGLAADIQRYLTNEPVVACPPSTAYRLKKFARRNKVVIATLTSIGLALLLGVGLALTQAAESRRQRDLAEAAAESEQQQRVKADEQRAEADEQRDEAERQRLIALRNAYVAEIRQADNDWLNGPVSRVRDALLHYVPQPGEPDLRQWEWYYFLSLLENGVLTVRESPRAASWSPNGEGLPILVAGDPPSVRDLTTGKTTLTLDECNGPVRATASSSDGQHIATLSTAGDAQVWDAVTGRVIATLPDRGVWQIAWSHDGRYLALAGSNGIALWQAGSDRTTRLDLSGKVISSRYGQSIAWSTTRARMAILTSGNRITVWDANPLSEVSTTPYRGLCRYLAWSLDGSRLAAIEHQGNVDTPVNEGPHNALIVWNPITGDHVLHQVDGDPFRLAWEPGGSRIAIAAFQGCYLLDADDGKVVLSLIGHAGAVDQVAWSRDGTHLASGGRDQAVRLWDPDTGEEIRTIRGHTGSIGRLNWASDGRHLASRSQNELKVWDAESVELSHLGGGTSVRTSSLSHDGRRVVSIGQDSEVILWDLTTVSEPRVLDSIPNESSTVGDEPRRRVYCSADGRRIAWEVVSGDVLTWDTTTHQRERWNLEPTNTPKRLAWSKDGAFLAATAGTAINVWATATGQEQLSFQAHRLDITALAWHNDRLASAAWDGLVKVWDPATGQLSRILAGHDRSLDALAWSRDGRFLASGGFDRVVKVWDVASGEEIHTLRGHAANLMAVAWAPNGQRLASLSRDDSVRIWDIASGQEVIALRVPAPLTPASIVWAPDGRRLIVVGTQGEVKQWDASPGYELAGGRSSDWTTALAPSDRSAIGTARSLAQAYSSHGEVMQAADRPEEALRWFQREVEIREEIPAAQRTADDVGWYGQALYLVGRFEDARQMFEKTIEMRGETEPTIELGPRWWRLTMALSRLGEMDKARSYYDKLAAELEAEENPSKADQQYRREAAELLGIVIEKAEDLGADSGEGTGLP